MYQSLRRDRLSEEVARQLTELIVSRQLAPGDYLAPEETLAEQFEVSRSVVREAIRTLESRYLVSRKRGVGTIVTDGYEELLANAMDLSIRGNRIPFQDFLSFRRIVEVGVVRRAVENATEEDLAALREALQRMDGDGHAEGSVEADVDFHVSLAAASHNAMLQIVIQATREVLRDSIERTRTVQTQPRSRRNIHAKILEAIEERDVEAAVAAIGHHLDDTERLLKRSGARWIARPARSESGTRT